MPFRWEKMSDLSAKRKIFVRNQPNQFKLRDHAARALR